MEREAVRVVVTRGDQLLLMRRNKFGKHYYTLVGGHIEPGEEPLQAMHREVDEETGLTLHGGRLVYVQDPVNAYNRQYIYKAEYTGGEIEMRPDAEEYAANQAGHNTYEPLWVAVSDVDGLPLFPEELKQRILHDIRYGFPQEPIKISPKGD